MASQSRHEPRRQKKVGADISYLKSQTPFKFFVSGGYWHEQPPVGVALDVLCDQNDATLCTTSDAVYDFKFLPKVSPKRDSSFTILCDQNNGTLSETSIFCVRLQSLTKGLGVRDTNESSEIHLDQLPRTWL